MHQIKKKKFLQKCTFKNHLFHRMAFISFDLSILSNLFNGTFHGSLRVCMNVSGKDKERKWNTVCLVGIYKMKGWKMFSVSFYVWINADKCPYIRWQPVFCCLCNSFTSSFPPGDTGHTHTHTQSNTTHNCQSHRPACISCVISLKEHLDPV